MGDATIDRCPRHALFRCMRGLVATHQDVLVLHCSA